MAAKIEFYDGGDWVPVLLGALQGINNQITVTQDPITKMFTVAIADNPVLPGDTTIDSTGYLKLPVGTDAERPSSPQAGMIRFNTSV